MSLEECIVTVLWPFLSEMPLYNTLLLRRVEPNDPGPLPRKICFETLLCSSAEKLPICNCPAAQWHPQQLYEWTKGERETNLPENFLLPRKSTSPSRVGFTLLAAVWWQIPNLVSQKRLGVEMPPRPQLFQDIFKLCGEPKSCQLPITSYLEQDIQIIISNCMATLACCRTSHFNSQRKGKRVCTFKAPSQL